MSTEREQKGEFKQETKISGETKCDSRSEWLPNYNTDNNR